MILTFWSNLIEVNYNSIDNNGSGFYGFSSVILVNNKIGGKLTTQFVLTDNYFENITSSITLYSTIDGSDFGVKFQNLIGTLGNRSFHLTQVTNFSIKLPFYMSSQENLIAFLEPSETYIQIKMPKPTLT